MYHPTVIIPLGCPPRTALASPLHSPNYLLEMPVQAHILEENLQKTHISSVDTQTRRLQRMEKPF